MYSNEFTEGWSKFLCRKAEGKLNAEWVLKKGNCIKKVRYY